MYKGTVTSLWHYPVKSMQGGKCSQLEINNRGVVNDRLYAVYNENGKIGSGKNTTRFRRFDGLIDLSAKLSVDGLSVCFPDDSFVCGPSRQLNQKLSDFLGREVELKKEGTVSHFDQGSIHIITTTMLAQLNDLIPTEGIDERRFRPNIVIDLTQPVLDQALLGKTLKVGEVELKITEQAQRCRMATMAQSELEKCPEILKTISQSFELNFGVYADVIKPGLIRIDEEIAI